MNLYECRSSVFPLHLVLNPCDDWAAYHYVLTTGYDYFRLFEVPGSDGNSTLAVRLDSWGEATESLYALVRHGRLLYGVEDSELTAVQRQLSTPFLSGRRMRVNTFHPQLLECVAVGLAPPPMNDDGVPQAPCLMNTQFDVLGAIHPPSAEMPLIELPTQASLIRKSEPTKRMVEFYAGHALMDIYRESFVVPGSPPLHVRHMMGLVDIQRHPLIIRFIEQHRDAVATCLSLYFAAFRKKLNYESICHIASAIAVGVDRDFTHSELIDMYKRFLALKSATVELMGGVLLDRVASHDIQNFIEQTDPSEY